MSALIELFPYKFYHAMYKEGGGSGLHYLSYQMSSGKEFPGVERHKSIELCIQHDSACKVHYRDAPFNFAYGDYGAILAKLKAAMDWYVTRYVESFSRDRVTLARFMMM